jgi:hypothetical protein
MHLKWGTYLFWIWHATSTSQTFVFFQNIHNNFGQIIRIPSFNDLLKKFQYKQVVSTLNNITMEWNPQLVINCDNFITRKDKILWTCNNFLHLFKHLVLLALSHYPINRIIPMLLRFMGTLKKRKPWFYGFNLKHRFALL